MVVGNIKVFQDRLTQIEFFCQYTSLNSLLKTVRTFFQHKNDTKYSCKREQATASGQAVKSTYTTHFHR